MKKAIFCLVLLTAGCDTAQNTDTDIDDLSSLTDSTAALNDNFPADDDFAPYGKAKAEELSANRKKELEAILSARGINAGEVPALVIAIRNAIGFNEWDVVEEGEDTQATGTNKEPVILTSLIFGPFDGNGRGYSVMAITGNRIYLSEDHWENSGIDSAYNIQMAADKKIEVTETGISIISPAKGKMQLKNIR